MIKLVKCFSLIKNICVKLVKDYDNRKYFYMGTVSFKCPNSLESLGLYVKKSPTQALTVRSKSKPRATDRMTHCPLFKDMASFKMTFKDKFLPSNTGWSITRGVEDRFWDMKNYLKKPFEASWWFYNHLRINEVHVPSIVAFIAKWLAWTVQRALKVSLHHEK